MGAKASIPLTVLAAFALTGCARESRSLGPTPSQTAPSGPGDPRIGDYLNNVYQVSQGGRYFSWYGCTRCHDAATPDLRRARLPTGRAFDATYRAIAQGHRGLAYGRRVPAEQLWQLTAYVADLPMHTPDKRNRQNIDQKGEPEGWAWSGPLR